GYDPEQLVKVWGIQGIGLATKLMWRLFIPVHLNGEIVSWTTRGITDAEPRYLSAPAECEAIPKAELLYGYDFTRHAIAVNEGHLDVWAIGPGAVGTGGVAYSQEQALLMAKF